MQKEGWLHMLCMAGPDTPVNPCFWLLQIMEEWQAKESERQAALSSVAGGVPTDESAEPQYVAYVPLPDEKEIELRVVERKKAELLAKYSTPGLQKLQQDAIDLLAAN